MNKRVFYLLVVLLPLYLGWPAQELFGVSPNHSFRSIVLDQVATPAPTDNKLPTVNVVHQIVAPASDGSGLALDLFLNVRDPQGQPIPRAEINTVDFDLNNQAGDPANVNGVRPTDPPKAPIKIALLLDESGSMLSQVNKSQRYIDIVRPLIRAAIDSAPDNAEIAVFNFSDIPEVNDVRPSLPFTSNKDDVKEFVNPADINNPKFPNYYNPKSGNPTCIYDAALGALQYLSQLNPDERRAVILFTDGTDERPAPDGSKKTVACSKHPVDNVIQKATAENGVSTSIYTVGLCPQDLQKDICPDQQLDTKALTVISDGTHAISRIGSSRDLQGAFVKIMSDIQNQIFIHAILKPCDEPEVLVKVNAREFKDPISTHVSIHSTCFTPRAILQLPQPNVQTFQSIFSASVQNTSSIPMNSIEYQISTPNQTTVYQNRKTISVSIAPGTTAAIPIPIPATDFPVPWQDGLYTLRVYAKGGGVPFLRKPDADIYSNETYQKEPDREVLAVTTWKIEFPKDIHIQVSPIDPPQNMLLTLKLQVTGDDNNIATSSLANAKLYSVDVTDGDCKLQKENIDVKPASTQNPFIVLEVPLDQTMSNVSADKNCKLQVTFTLPAIPNVTSTAKPYLSDPQSFTISKTPDIPFIQRMIQAIQANGLLIGVILLFVMGIVGILLYPRLRPRTRTIAAPRPQNEATVLVPPKPREKTPREKTLPEKTLLEKAPPNDATVLHTPDPVAKPRVRLHVRVTQTPDQMQIHDRVFSTFPVVIGRSKGDLIITGDPKISGAHVQISEANDGFLVTDLNSTNGTMVGDKKLEKGEKSTFSTRTVVRLGPNTVIELEPKK